MLEPKIDGGLEPRHGGLKPGIKDLGPFLFYISAKALISLALPTLFCVWFGPGRGWGGGLFYERK